jgi:hypothetical protein
MSPFRDIALSPPESSQNRQSADIARKRRSNGAQLPGYRPTRVLHATVTSGSGPARKHTAKFEPAAWSWAQMTSDSGAPKRILSGVTLSSSNFKGQIEYLDRRARL